MEGYPEITKDNWNGGIQIEGQPNTDGYTEMMRSYEPFAMPYIKITSANDAYDYVTCRCQYPLPRYCRRTHYRRSKNRYSLL